MLNQRIFKNISNSGLNEKEALVYTTLAELGGAFPSRISELTKINRSTVYKILMDLQIKGLISEIEKRKKQYYQIESPSKLVRYAKDQIKIANDQLENAEMAQSELSGLFGNVLNKPRVTFFEGPDTVEVICDDMVSGEGNYEMLTFSNAKVFKSLLSPAKLKKFVKEKEKKNIITKAIVPDTQNDRLYSEDVFRGIAKGIWPELRYVASSDFPFEAEITIYGKNKVAIVKLGGENQIGVIIEDHVIHGMMSMIFKMAWPTAKTN